MILTLGVKHKNNKNSSCKILGFVYGDIHESHCYQHHTNQNGLLL